MSELEELFGETARLDPEDREDLSDELLTEMSAAPLLLTTDDEDSPAARLRKVLALYLLGLADAGEVRSAFEGLPVEARRLLAEFAYERQDRPTFGSWWRTLGWSLAVSARDSDAEADGET